MSRYAPPRADGRRAYVVSVGTMPLQNPIIRNFRAQRIVWLNKDEERKVRARAKHRSGTTFRAATPDDLEAS